MTIRTKIWLFLVFLIAIFFGVKEIKYVYDFGREFPKISKNGLFLKCVNPNNDYDNKKLFFMTKNIFGKYNNFFVIEEHMGVWKSEDFTTSDDKKEYIASSTESRKPTYLLDRKLITTTYSINRQNLKVIYKYTDELETDANWKSRGESYSCEVRNDDFHEEVKNYRKEYKKKLFEEKEKRKRLNEETEDNNII